MPLHLFAVIATSSTSSRLDFAPMAPPGWFFLNTLFVSSSCNASATVNASISPTAIVTVVLVVGAHTPNEVSSSSCMGAGNRTEFGLVSRSGHSDGFVCDVIAMIGVCEGMWARRAMSSAVLPE